MRGDLVRGKYISVKKLEEMGIKIRKCEVCERVLPKYAKKWCSKECKSEACKKRYMDNKGKEKNGDGLKVFKSFKQEKEVELLKEIRDLLNDISIELRKEG